MIWLDIVTVSGVNRFDEVGVNTNGLGWQVAAADVPGKFKCVGDWGGCAGAGKDCARGAA